MSDSASDTFSITDAQINFAGVLAFACTIPGTCICFLVLVAYGIAACFPSSRKEMDRVSFRLLVLTLVFNVFFGIAYAATPTSPGGGCGVGAFFVNFTLSFSTFFTTCIAINLQLVLVHRVNGKKMEKYYYIGTTLLSILLNVPTFGLHQFGWDEESATCWYDNADDKIRLRWIIGTQSFWISLAATIETICSFVVLIWLYNYQKTTNLMVNVRPQDPTVHSNATNAIEQSIDFTQSSPSTMVRMDYRYRKVILRIVLYPIVSLIVNYTTVALDLNTTIVGLNTQMDFRLLVLDLIMYGVRTLGYGILAAADPAFISAIQQLYYKHRKRTTNQFQDGTLNLDFATHGRTQADMVFSGSMNPGGTINVELGNSETENSSTKNATETFNTRLAFDTKTAENSYQKEEIQEFARHL